MKQYIKLCRPFVLTFFAISISFFAIGQSYFLGKSQSYVIQENGQDYRLSEQDGLPIIIYKRVSKKGSVDNDMYYFRNDRCIKIVQGYDMWFLLLWGNELSDRYKRIDQHNWIEKDNILHSVAVLNEDKFIYIIKYKDY